MAGCRAAAPAQSTETASFCSGVQRRKASARGELTDASTRTGYCLTRRTAERQVLQKQVLKSQKEETEIEQIKATRHNGRSGQNGVYNPKHNDRRFDVENSEHINAEKTLHNIYWDCYNGAWTAGKAPERSFADIELQYYEQHYSAHVFAQNARNEKNRHPERNRTAQTLLNNRNTAPEETIYQFGTMEYSVSAETLVYIVNDFFMEFEKRFGDHVHILDWALHVDEGSPHIHERHVFDCENEYGELCPQQEKALEALGIALPDETKKKGPRNNRKIKFDSICRTLLIDIAKKHGLEIDEEPSYGGREYLEKQDYILMKQKEKLAEQAERIMQADEQLNDLTMKIEDVETLIDEVSDIAYDKAVEAVTDVVREETQKEDITLIEDRKKWLLSPERKTSKEKREYAASQLDGIITQIKKLMRTAVGRLHDVLMKPEVKQTAKAQIKTQARESVLKKLRDYAEASKKTDAGVRGSEQRHEAAGRQEKTASDVTL